MEIMSVEHLKVQNVNVDESLLLRLVFQLAYWYS